MLGNTTAALGIGLNQEASIWKPWLFLSLVETWLYYQLHPLVFCFPMFCDSPSSGRLEDLIVAVQYLK